MNLALAQSALVFALVIYLLLPVGKLELRARVLVLTTLMVCSLIPINGLPLVFYWRALLDDLAITTLVLLVAGAARHTLHASPAKRAATDTPPRRISPLVFFAVLGLFLYPATLGLSPVDPYRLGYQPDLLLILGGVAALAFCYWRQYIAAVALTLATLAFLRGLHDSNNYWDYVIDPALAVYALMVSVRWGFSAATARIRQLRNREAVLPVRQNLSLD